MNLFEKTRTWSIIKIEIKYEVVIINKEMFRRNFMFLNKVKTHWLLIVIFAFFVSCITTPSPKAVKDTEAVKKRDEAVIEMEDELDKTDKSNVDNKIEDSKD